MRLRLGLLEDSQAEHTSLNKQVCRLQNDLIVARRDIAETRRQSTDAIAHAAVLERQLETERAEHGKAEALQNHAGKLEERLDEAQPRETGGQLRLHAAQMASSHAEQVARVPGLKKFIRGAEEHKEGLLKQVQEEEKWRTIWSVSLRLQKRRRKAQPRNSSLHARIYRRRFRRWSCKVCVSCFFLIIK